MISIRACRICALILICWPLVFCQSLLAEELESQWWVEQVQLPTGLKSRLKTPIVVAVIDDAFDIGHSELQPFIWIPPYEIANNAIGDDGNGLIDDQAGWDLADNDNDVQPPRLRRDDYYHGTHLAGLIARIVRLAYGDQAKELLRILPVKATSDNSPDLSIRYGYRGIDLASRMGADIIVCGWNKAAISAEEEDILNRAHRRGSLVIASAGNYPDENMQFPAADPSVFAVTALAKDNCSNSNYGSFVDLAAPGNDIVSAVPVGDQGQASHSGSSQATALVAGAAVVIAGQMGHFSSEKIQACLKNGARLHKKCGQDRLAKLGAGRLDIRGAIDALHANEPATFFSKRPQGWLSINASDSSPQTWTIRPDGQIKGIWFYRPSTIGADDNDMTISFSLPSPAKTDGLHGRFSLKDMPARFFVPGPQSTVTISQPLGGTTIPTTQWLMPYKAEAIKYRDLYCRDTVHLNEPGLFSDGSETYPYAAGTNCKWLITAPVGKVVHFRFTSFDTEAQKDLLYFFNGEGTHEKIMALFSGPLLPPEFTTWSNKVLVWFVSDMEDQGEGWQGEFTFIDRDEAVYLSK